MKKLLFVLPIVFLLFGCESETNNTQSNMNSNSSENNTSQNESNAEESKELTEAEKMVYNLALLIDEKLVFDTGSYIKGDIPKGEYAFIKIGDSSYYEEDDAAGNIIDNENFDSFGYVYVHAAGDLETHGVLVSTKAFSKLGVTGAKQLYEIINEQENYNQAGYYKVGTDIPAGNYIVESMGSGYYAVMSGPVSNSDIVKNDNFNGKKTVTVKKGQYLEVSRATIKKK